MLNYVKRSLPEGLKRRVKHAMGFQDMETRLRNVRRAGFVCTGAVDVGAYAADWALLAHDVFGCPVLLVEPQPQQQDVLRRRSAGKPFEIEPLALSAQAGTLDFQLQETNSRLLSESESTDLPRIRVPVERLDTMLARHAGMRPNLLKVDVQGSELAVLDGAGNSLSQFEIIILEVSIIRIGPVPVFKEVLDYMGARNFRLYDFLPMYHRPLDGALWQGDAFFVRNDSRLVASEQWE
jgi:FkbM family methyltransferase